MTDKRPWAVLWDLDGTLVDTAEEHFQSWRRLAHELGANFGPAEFAATFGRRNPEVIRALFGRRTDADVEALGDRKETYYRAAAAARGVSILPGARELIEALRVAGVRQALATSAPRANVTFLVEHTSTAEVFGVFACAEDVSRGKPDPEVFFKAAERLAVAPENALVIEDSPAGIAGARAANMAAVAVLAASHASAAELLAAGASRVVGSLADLTVDDLRALLRCDSSRPERGPTRSSR